MVDLFHKVKKAEIHIGLGNRTIINGLIALRERCTQLRKSDSALGKRHSNSGRFLGKEGSESLRTIHISLKTCDQRL